MLVAAAGAAAAVTLPSFAGENAAPRTAPPSTPPAGDLAACTGQVSRTGQVAAGRAQLQPDGR